MAVGEQTSDAVAPPLLVNQFAMSESWLAVLQLKFRSLAFWVIVGAVLSTIVKVACAVVLLPQSSVAVKVTRDSPVAPQSSLSVVKSLGQVAALHESNATAPPWLFSQLLSSVVLPGPSQNTVKSLGLVVISGDVVSSIVKVAVVVLLLPQSSVAVKVMIEVPVAPHASIVNGS